MTCSPRALDTRARTPGIYSPARARARVRSHSRFSRTRLVCPSQSSLAYASREPREEREMKNERETASPPSSSPAIDSKCHVSRASIRPSVRSYVRTYVRTVVRAITRPQGALGEQQFRSMSLVNLSKIAVLHLSVTIRVKPRARVTYAIL